LFFIANLQGWHIFLIVLAGILALLFIAYQCMLCWATHAYAKIVQNNTISINDFVNEHPTPSQCLKCILLNHFNVGKKIPSTEILELCVEESDKVEQRIYQTGICCCQKLWYQETTTGGGYHLHGLWTSSDCLCCNQLGTR
jgi:hypothetical protein